MLVCITMENGPRRSTRIFYEYARVTIGKNKLWIPAGVGCEPFGKNKVKSIYLTSVVPSVKQLVSMEADGVPTS